jgi:hypothetical protein
MTLDLEASLDIVLVCTKLGIGDRTSVNAAHRRWIDEQSADPISSIPKLRAREQRINKAGERRFVPIADGYRDFSGGDDFHVGWHKSS